MRLPAPLRRRSPDGDDAPSEGAGAPEGTGQPAVEGALPDGAGAPPEGADSPAGAGAARRVSLPGAGRRALRGRVDGSAWRATPEPTPEPTAEPTAGASVPPKSERPRWPLYVRLLHLRHIAPNAWQRAVLGEGSLALAAVLVLADLVTAWTLLVLPLAVAALVKAHDLLARLLGRPEVPPPAPRRAKRTAPVVDLERTDGAGPSGGDAVGGGAG